MRTRVTAADYPLVILAVALSLFGIAAVYSAGQTEVGRGLVNIWRMQTLYVALGIGAAWTVSRTPVRILDYLTPVIYVGTIAVLVLLLFIGGGRGSAASTKSWLYIGNVSIGQPAELAKIAVVIMLAKVLAGRGDAPKSLREFWKPTVILLVPWMLIVLQRDMGTAMVFIGIYFAMLFWAGTDWKLLMLAASPVISVVLAFSTPIWGAWFFVLLVLLYWSRLHVMESVMVVIANLATGVAAPVAWAHLLPHQQQRLRVYLDPSMDPRNSGYHVLQSQVAIGSGGWFGKGFTLGTQKRSGFLPEQETDFIFAVIGEELGFVGVVVALALFGWLMMRCVRIAGRSANVFASLTAFGLVSMFFVHIVVNVGMTIGVMPITGIPLPFFSYGGSFMLACWIAIGLLVRLSLEGRGRADTLVI